MSKRKVKKKTQEQREKERLADEAEYKRLHKATNDPYRLVEVDGFWLPYCEIDW